MSRPSSRWCTTRRPHDVGLRPSSPPRTVYTGHVTGAQCDHHHPEPALIGPVPRAALGRGTRGIVWGGNMDAVENGMPLPGICGPGLRSGGANSLQDRPVRTPGQACRPDGNRGSRSPAPAWRVMEAFGRHVLSEPVARRGWWSRAPSPSPGGSRRPRCCGPASVHLDPRAVRVDAHDGGVGLRRLADVAGRADVEVQLAVRPEGQVLPAVRQVSSAERSLSRTSASGGL